MSKQNNRLVLKIIVFAGKLFLLFKMYSIIVLKEVMFMNFKEVLNKYLKELNCSSKKLSNESGLSESVISRYRSGERTPVKNSEQLNKLTKIVKSEASKIELEDYKTNEFSIKIPKGWKVDTLGDYIHYTIKVYNPDKPLYQFFLNMKTEGYNKSEDAKRWQQKYYPNDMFAKTSVIATKDTEGFYKIFNDLGTLNNTAAFTFPTLTDFTVSENLGKGSLGGDILRATFKDTNGEEGEGIFTAYVYDVGTYYVYENIISGKQIDIQYLNVYDTIFITTPKDEFIDWEDTLNTICSSLSFTDTFINGFNQQQDAVMKNFQQIRAIGNEISDGIMDSWNKRNTSFDIMSQKQSDATLGYERVYDTETNEIYKAYNGFNDEYDGERYKPVTDDMYLQKTSGYIEK
jgi:DNA-binding Xre family transcriptional regulator